MHSKTTLILLIATAISICLPIVSSVLTFEDEDFWGREADTYEWEKHPCRRKCSDYETPRTCRYVFVVEKFTTMSKACYNCPFNNTDCFGLHCITADGVQKPIYTVNRRLPGPLVEVCKNDWVVIDLRNQMLSESVTLHWHGFKQFYTPYMDGVPYVTQCPILPGQSFEYVFRATTTGTFFYHSHIGSQRGDGLFGPMIVNDVYSEDIYIDEYDEDVHRMVINEWTHKTSEADEIRDNHVRFDAVPETILINGHGRFETLRNNGSTAQTPLFVFEVQHGKKYRIRAINAGSANCPIVLSIDNHPMDVIALDSKYIQPVTVDAITSWSGERYDFILNATQRSGNYWIRVKGLVRCQNSTTEGAYGLAILRYVGAAKQDPTTTVGYQYPVVTSRTRILNPYDAVFDSSQRVNVSIANLTAMDFDDLCSKAIPDQQVYLSFDAYPIDNYDFHRKNLYGYYNFTDENVQINTLQFNHISLKMPSVPLLSQYEEIDPRTLCNSSYIPLDKDCRKEQCACPHVINVALDSVVEIVLVDEGTYTAVNHPFHLHGHFIRVMAEQRISGNVTVEQVKALDRAGRIHRNLHHAPIKDTMKAPSSGYSIVRFYANNPGYWLFHCHFDPHSNMGMALVFKVGEHEDFPPRPRNFPTCRSYTYSGF